MPNLNPMGINGPSWAGNYVQPNTANPTVNAALVANYPVATHAIGGTWPVPVYSQPGTTYAAVPRTQLANPMGLS